MSSAQEQLEADLVNAPEAQSSPEDRLPIARSQALRNSGVFRSDDFVDIPLNSPATSHRSHATANGRAARAQPGRLIDEM